VIVTLSGEPGAGKSTCARGICRSLSLKHYSTGDLMRQLAHERGMNIQEFSRVAEKDRSIDEELDTRQKKLGETEDDFVIDGRLSAFFIPHAVKVFLTSDLTERARRVYFADRASERSGSEEEARRMLVDRQDSELRRYRDWYGLNPYDPAHYDIVVHTSGKGIDIMIGEVVEAIQRVSGGRKNVSR